MAPARKNEVKGKWDRARVRIDEFDERTDGRIRDLVTAHRRRLIDLERPTAYMPGSDEKVAIMGARYRVGLPIFAKGDASHTDVFPVHCPTTTLDRPTFAACRILEVLE